MIERSSDRWVSIVQSVLLHGAVIALLGYGWWTYKQRPKPVQPSLAIEAVAMDESAVRAPEREVPPPPEPQPLPEPPPEQTGPPTPSPEEIAAREAEAQRRLEEERRLEEQRLAEQKRLEEERRLAEERAAAERKAREEAEAKRREEERLAEERRLAEEKRKAEELRLAEERRKAEEKRRAEEKRKVEEARARAQREADLRRRLEEEERLMAARSSGALAQWQAQIAARIQRAWLRPPSARPGIDCIVYVTQVPGGEVTNARVGECNGDQAVRESIESAVYRASPLPPPPDPALFERNLEIRFVPTD